MGDVWEALGVQPPADAALMAPAQQQQQQQLDIDAAFLKRQQLLEAQYQQLMQLAYQQLQQFDIRKDVHRMPNLQPQHGPPQPSLTAIAEARRAAQRRPRQQVSPGLSDNVVVGRC